MERKTIERRSLRQGQQPLGERINAQGERVYLVQADDDAVLNKTNALISKAVRTLALRHLPGDILDECMEQCIDVARRSDAEDPDAARKRLLDAFYQQGVSADQIALYLGHDPTALNPAELMELRAVYAALQQGEASWRDILEHKTGEPTDEQANAAEAKKRDATSKLVEKHRKQQAAKRAPAEREPGQEG